MPRKYTWLPDARTMQVYAPEEGRVYTLGSPRPEGLGCGHAGPEAENLALSILVDALGQNAAADLYCYFKWDVICRKSSEVRWSITEDEILTWKDEMVGELRRRLLAAGA
jgi:hypothetical protein